MFKVRRSNRIFGILATVAYLAGALSLALGFSLTVPPAEKAFAGSGAIWTTAGDCVNPQDKMDYAIGEWVQLNGDGWDPGVTVDWRISGTGGSCKPGIFETGIVVPDSNGVFCFQMYQGQPDDCGPYHVNARQYDDPFSAGDNFRIIGLPDLITIGDYVWADLNGNGIQDDGAAGIAGVTVTLQIWEQQGGGSWDFASSTATNASGYYQFLVVPDTYRVVFPTGLAGYTGLTTQNAGGDTVDSDADPATGATHGITLAGGASDLTLDAGYVPELVPGSILVTKTANPTDVPETGGLVDYTFLIENNGPVPVTLESFNDSVFPDPPGNCTVPQLLFPGETYSCTLLDEWLSGDPLGPGHLNEFVVTFSYEGGSDSASDQAVVTFTDLLPVIRVEKVADPPVVPIGGGLVTYTVTVYNDSDEPVTLTSLVDDRVGGSILGMCAPPPAGPIPAHDSYTCQFIYPVTGAPGSTITNNVTAIAVDDDGNQAGALGSASVDIQQAIPSITVTKAASPDSVDETGGDVTFTVVVSNSGNIPMMLVSLIDSVFGDLTAIPGSTCSLPQPPLNPPPLPGSSYSCQFTVELVGDASGPEHVDVVTATAVPPTGGPDVQDFDSAIVGFNDVPPDFSVTKTPDPASMPEPGGDVTYTVVVTNNSGEELTLDSLIDDVFGDLTLIPGTTCTVPVLLDPAGGLDDSYTCTFVGAVTGQPGQHTNTVSANASDNDGNSDTQTAQATVTIIDLGLDFSVTKTPNPTSVPETGGNVTYTVLVTNNTQEELTLDSLIDNVFGDLTTYPGSTCSVTQTLAASGGSYGCSFTVLGLSGEAGEIHSNTVSATASDDDGNQGIEQATAEVLFTNVEPVISVLKTADPVVVLETGADVTYAVTVTNWSTESLTLGSLVDDVYGNLDGVDSCSVPQTLAPSGGDYYCEFTVFVSGSAGDLIIDTVTAIAADNDNNFDVAFDVAGVTVQDVEPNITVTKTADPLAVPETGGDVTFTIVVTNVGDVPVWLLSLIDDQFGDLTLIPGSTCSVPQGPIAPLGSYSCSFTVELSGEAEGIHENVITALAEDADENEIEATDPAQVEFLDVLPEIVVTKDVNRSSVPATGGNVNFTVEVVNLALEEVVLTSLVDSVFGNLNGVGDCFVPQVLAPAGDPDDSYSCSFTKTISGGAGTTHRNVVTATATDREQNQTQDSDGAAVYLRGEPGPTPTPPPLIPVTGVDRVAQRTVAGGFFRSFGVGLLGCGLVMHGMWLRRRRSE